jgi:hypothetical protein
MVMKKKIIDQKCIVNDERVDILNAIGKVFNNFFDLSIRKVIIISSRFVFSLTFLHLVFFSRLRYFLSFSRSVKFITYIIIWEFFIKRQINVFYNTCRKNVAERKNIACEGGSGNMK